MIKNTPPKGQSYIWLTRQLLESEAWHSLDLYTRRLLDFLMLEHLRHAGQANGKLKAPYRQLHTFGIWDRFISSTITRAEELGLVVCYRGGMRTATEYRLTWFESHDGKPATDEWRAYRNPDLPHRCEGRASQKSEICPQGVKAGLHHTCEGSCITHVKADKPDLHHTGEGTACITRVKALSREASTTGERCGERGPRNAAATEPPSTVVPLRRRRGSRPHPDPAPNPDPGKDHHR